MTGRDKYRATTAAILLVLGVIIVARAITDGRAWPVAVLGTLLLAIGVYRLNQVRVYMRSAGK